jgi:hypothetical protein
MHSNEVKNIVNSNFIYDQIKQIESKYFSMKKANFYIFDTSAVATEILFSQILVVSFIVFRGGVFY